MHHWRDVTWHKQQLIGNCCRPYHWVADRHSTPAWKRWVIARRWYEISQQVPPPPAPMSGFPDQCVAIAEESGHNSVAGYFGTIYPPGSYAVAASALVSTYGYSWLNWPYSAQLVHAQQLYAKYGGSAWGPLTREKCGI